jgi:hypothetical protein
VGGSGISGIALPAPLRHVALAGITTVIRLDQGKVIHAHLPMACAYHLRRVTACSTTGDMPSFSRITWRSWIRPHPGAA